MNIQINELQRPLVHWMNTLTEIILLNRKYDLA